MFWNLRQPGGCFCLVSPPEPLVEALNRFAGSYWAELVSAMRRRLGVRSYGMDADSSLAQAAFQALAAGGEPLRWEPFFFDWFGGDEARALAGVRGDIYREGAFEDFRAQLATFEPVRPGALSHPYFAAPEPQELIYEEIEAIWARIDQADDWSAFEAKLAAIETARQAYGLSEG